MKKQENNFSISGKTVEIEMPQRISDTFTKRVLIMEVFNGKFRNEVPFDFVNEGMKQIENVRPGDWVTINWQFRANRKERDGGAVRRYITCEGISCYKE